MESRDDGPELALALRPVRRQTGDFAYLYDTLRFWESIVWQFSHKRNWQKYLSRFTLARKEAAM
jgi:hypothetical protein